MKKIIFLLCERPLCWRSCETRTSEFKVNILSVDHCASRPMKKFTSKVNSTAGYKMVGPLALIVDSVFLCYNKIGLTRSFNNSEIGLNIVTSYKCHAVMPVL